jgi:hypothetical protein
MKEYDLAVCCCLSFKLDRVYSRSDQQGQKKKLLLLAAADCVFAI